MDAFLKSSVQMRLGSDGNVSDEVIRKALENFILSETEPFSIIESEKF